MELTTAAREAWSQTTDTSSLHGLVIFAKDVQRLSSFYQVILQLDIIESKKSHHVLANDTLELVIHAISIIVADSIEIETPPHPREKTALKPMFRVHSLIALRPLITANAGSLKPLKTAWSIRGDRVLDGCDPEGNVLQFRENQ